MKEKINQYSSGVMWFSLLAASVFALFGLIAPPLGVISPSALLLVGQFLVFCAGVIFGSATAIRNLAHITELIENISKKQ